MPGHGNPAQKSRTSPAILSSSASLADVLGHAAEPAGDLRHLRLLHAARRAPTACRGAGRSGRTACAGRPAPCCSCTRGRRGRAPSRAPCPVIPRGVTSIRIRWLSVPPETSLKPRPASASASARAFATIWCAYALNSSVRRFLQRDRDAGGRVVVRPALQAGEHRLVDRLRHLLLAQQHGAARPAQRLVRRRRDDVGVRDRRRVRAAGDQARDVRDVHQQVRARPRRRSPATPRSR